MSSTIEKQDYSFWTFEKGIRDLFYDIEVSDLFDALSG